MTKKDLIIEQYAEQVKALEEENIFSTIVLNNNLSEVEDQLTEAKEVIAKYVNLCDMVEELQKIVRQLMSFSSNVDKGILEKLTRDKMALRYVGEEERVGRSQRKRGRGCDQESI